MPRTGRLLRALRREGYFTQRVRDTSQRVAWDIWCPRINHNWTTGRDDVNLDYIAKVERYGSISFGASNIQVLNQRVRIGTYSPFGRPFFYTTADQRMTNTPQLLSATGIARQYGAEIREQRP